MRLQITPHQGKVQDENIFAQMTMLPEFEKLCHHESEYRKTAGQCLARRGRPFYVVERGINFR